MQHLIAGFDAGPKSASGIGNDKTLAVAIWKRPKATDFSGISILVAGPRRFQRRAGGLRPVLRIGNSGSDLGPISRLKSSLELP
jgi:hypothetical protein